MKKQSEDEAAYHRKGLLLSLIVAFTMSFLSSITGHHSAQILHEHSPEKLAAAEGLFETTKYAPLAIGGYTDPETEEVKYGIEIPWLLSWLAGGTFDTEVKGLYEFPRETWPPFYVHTLFNLMVGIGSLLLAVAGAVLLYWWFFVRKRGAAFQNGCCGRSCFRDHYPCFALSSAGYSAAAEDSRGPFTGCRQQGKQPLRLPISVRFLRFFSFCTLRLASLPY
jgi:cytochrome bd-type quinol oxidase subunit 1